MIREEAMLKAAIRQTINGWRQMYGRSITSPQGGVDAERLRSLCAARAACDVAGELIALAVFTGADDRTTALVTELIGRVQSASTKSMEDLMKLASDQIKRNAKP